MLRTLVSLQLCPANHRPVTGPALAAVGAAAALVLSAAAPAQAASVSVSFQVLSWKSTFAEHSSLFTAPGFTTWQGGALSWVLPGGIPVPPVAVPLTGGVDPWTQVSPGGVQHSTPREHLMRPPVPQNAPNAPVGVVFADRLGWRTADGAFFYPPFDTSPDRDNAIFFQPAAATSVGLGESFRLGSFTVRNGSWHAANNGAPGPVEVAFRLTTRSADPLFDGHVVEDTFLYQTFSTGPGGTAEENADAFWLAGRPELGAVRVFEDASGTFDLYGSINSLHLERFGGATGGAFLTATVGPIPEPSAFAMLAAGLGTLAWLRRRRGSASA